MKKIVSFLLLAFWQVCLYAGNYEVLSPNGKLKVALSVSDVLGMEVFYDGQLLFSASNMGLCLQQTSFKPLVSFCKTFFSQRNDYSGSTFKICFCTKPLQCNPFKFEGKFGGRISGI